MLRVYSTGSLPTGLQEDKEYFVTNSTAGSFQLAHSKYGAPIAVTGVGSGSHSINYIKHVAADFVFDGWSVISGMAKLTDASWVAVAGADNNASRGILVTHDSGASWAVDDTHDWNVNQIFGFARQPLISDEGKPIAMGGGPVGYRYRPPMLEGVAAIDGYSYIIDQVSDTMPDEVIDGVEDEISYSGLADGEWYFHVRAHDDSGNWGAAAHRRIGINTTGSACGVKPGLVLETRSIYWNSMADYFARLLSVDSDIINEGNNDSYAITVIASPATNAVVNFPDLPAPVDITLGQSAPITLKYTVPHGVASFRTTTYVTAEDACGEGFIYPGELPES
jgi:hypothetical protein